MSADLNPYLNFDGNCAEAMRFYGEVLGVEPSILWFKDAPMPAPPGSENRVIHATVAGPGFSLMASDTMPGMPFTMGSNVYLSLGFKDRDEQTRVFEALSAGGRVEMALGEQFFGRFGSLTDRFGVHWMVMLETPREP